MGVDSRFCPQKGGFLDLFCNKTAPAARRHLQTQHPGADLVLEDVSYSFKDGYYHAQVTDPGSRDGDFTLTLSMGGRLLYDGYDAQVRSGENTARRLRNAYRQLVDGVLADLAFPCTVRLGFGDLAFGDSAVDSTRPYAIPPAQLTQDGVYDIPALGARAGEVTLCLEAEEVSVPHLGALLLDIKDRFSKAGVPFYAVHCVLEAPRPAKSSTEPTGDPLRQTDGPTGSAGSATGPADSVTEPADSAAKTTGGSTDSADGSATGAQGTATACLEVRGFLWDDLYAQGLEQRLAAAIQATADYYAQQYALKQQQG